VTNAGCPTSRSFFARCGIPQVFPSRLSRADRSTRVPLVRPSLSVPVRSICEENPRLLRKKSAFLGELRGESGGVPHLAKNERDVGHPAIVAGLESKSARRTSPATLARTCFRFLRCSVLSIILGHILLDGEVEATPTTRIALRPNPSSVLIHNPAGQRQSQSRTTLQT
jgi:hypothetical protein